MSREEFYNKWNPLYESDPDLKLIKGLFRALDLDSGIEVNTNQELDALLERIKVCVISYGDYKLEMKKEA